MLKALILKLLTGIGLVEPPDFIAETVPTHPTPAQLEEGKLFVVKDGKLDKWACFKCPGGCGEKIMLSLLPDRRPRWAVKLDWFRRPSVQPSVWQQNECGCHFWIKGGNVAWCDGGRPHLTK